MFLKRNSSVLFIVRAIVRNRNINRNTFKYLCNDLANPLELSEINYFMSNLKLEL